MSADMIALPAAPCMAAGAGLLGRALVRFYDLQNGVALGFCVALWYTVDPRVWILHQFFLAQCALGHAAALVLGVPPDDRRCAVGDWSDGAFPSVGTQTVAFLVAYLWLASRAHRALRRWGSHLWALAYLAAVVAADAYGRGQGVAPTAASLSVGATLASLAHVAAERVPWSRWGPFMVPWRRDDAVFRRGPPAGA
jgi:hypothetical protein